MSLPVLTVPKELFFPAGSLVQFLKMENTSPFPAVFKIKSNQKTALSINCSHDFIPANSLKQIPIKLLEPLPSIKLEINYSRATEQMLANNDSKMNGIDKSLITKNLVKIIIEASTTTHQQSADKSMNQSTEEINTSVDSAMYKSVPISAPVPQELQTIKEEAAPTKSLQIVLQNDEQDLQDFEEKKKGLLKSKAKIEQKIAKKRQILEAERESNKQMINQLSFVKPPILLSILVCAFLMGSLVRYVLF